MMFFILLMIVLFFIVCIEITKYFMVVYNVETNLQRVANNAIEFNMDDAWRRDGYTYVNPTETEDYAINTLLRPDNYNYLEISAGSPSHIDIPTGTLWTGSRYSKEGDYLYTIALTKITAGNTNVVTAADGTETPLADNTPYMEFVGMIYIAPSITGLDESFAFIAPIEIKSTNIKLNEGISGNNVGGEIEVPEELPTPG